MSTPLTRTGLLPSPLVIDYERAPVDALLAQDGVLAVIGFGGAAIDDPRVLRPGLARLDGDAPLQEVWRVEAPVVCGREGDLRWSRNDEYLYFAIELDEAAYGGVDAAAEHAYRTICAFVEHSSTPHFLRLWNYLDAINLGDGDDERYRLFCSGRARGMDARMHASYPAATAIGRQDGERVLQVYGLAARHAGAPVENPRQVSAWRYPRQYGPTAPTFARGMHTAASQLLISGTAAVVGHASRHHADLAAQIDETLANLRSLLGEVDPRRTDLGEDTLLKVYVRDPHDGAFVGASLRRQLPALAGLLVLSGDICRSELLVEVDGVHRLDD